MVYKKRKSRHYGPGVPHLTRQRGKSRIWYGFVNGKEVCLSTSDAHEAGRELVRLTTNGERPPEVRTRATSSSKSLSDIATAFIDYIQPPRKTEKTARTYENRVVAFIEWCEKNGVLETDQVDFALMTRFCEERSRDVGTSTINRDLTAVRSMFAHAKRMKLIPANPFKSEDFSELRMREAQTHRTKPTLSQADVAKVVAHSSEILGSGYGALVALVAGTGMRIDEARHIEESDVEILNETQGYIHVTNKPDWHTKSYRERRIPVSRATCEAALVYLRERHTLRMDDKATWDVLNVVEKELKLPHFSMHDLRRAWATALHDNGASLKVVSSLLGHSGVAVTERYIRVVRDEGLHRFLPQHLVSV